MSLSGQVWKRRERVGCDPARLYQEIGQYPSRLSCYVFCICLFVWLVGYMTVSQLNPREVSTVQGE